MSVDVDSLFIVAPFVNGVLCLVLLSKQASHLQTTRAKEIQTVIHGRPNKDNYHNFAV